MPLVCGSNMDAKRDKNAARTHFDTLPPEAKRRYAEKTMQIDGVDPYELPKSSWSTNPDDLPDISYIEIVNYFVFGKSAYTKEEFKAYKSLKAYKLFVAGWVREVWTYRPDGCNNTVVTAKVLHSQRMNEKPLTPWVISSAEGIILSAHCSCMAGLGETCTHVAALTFAVDAFNSAREKTTCTGEKAYWKVPHGIKGVNPKPACDIDFASARAKKNKVEHFIQNEEATVVSTSTQKRLFYVPAPSEAELAELFQQLDTCATKANVLRVLPEYCDQYIVPAGETISLRALRQQQCVGKSLAELQEYCKSVNVSITVEDSKQLEEATREQADSQLWFSARAGRVTASKFHAVCRADVVQPSVSLVQQICYPEKSRFTSVYTDWGMQNEGHARQDYVRCVSTDHCNFSLRSSGVYVPPEYPFLGATPDGIVSCGCHGTGCLEIKCPFTFRNTGIDEALSDKKFCLHRTDDGKLDLKQSDQYYSQVQAQLFLTKSAYCDFVVWTTVDMAIVRVFPNQTFWDDCYEKACKFFRLAILSELVGNWTEQLSKKGTNKRPQVDTDSSEENSVDCYCVCGEGEHGRMIACDNADCPIEWFHFQCVGLKRKPKGVWYCPECAKSVSGSKKQKT